MSATPETERLREEIEATREQLGDTVEALVAKPTQTARRVKPWLLPALGVVVIGMLVVRRRHG